MKKHLLFCILAAVLMITGIQLSAQVGINTDGSQPDPSAMLDVKSSTLGILTPRMTFTERDAIASPAKGLLVFCTDNDHFYVNKGTPALPNWIMLSNFSGVTVTSPLVSTGGENPTLSIPQANSTTNGFLSWADWSTFYNKQNPLAFGNVSSADMAITGGNGAVIGSGMSLTLTKSNLTSADLTITGGSNAVLGTGTSMTIKKSNLTEANSSVLTIAGGTNAVLGTGTTIQVKQAGTSQSGYLSNTDWNTFNSKQSAVTFGNLSSNDITVTGGADAVKGSGAALTINKGSITSPDMNIAGGSNAVLGTGTSLSINKGNLTETGSSVLNISGGGSSVLGTGATIQVKQANAGQSGYLGSADWNSFNNKVSSQWVSNGAKLYYNLGNVGIGTSNPQNKADIAGNAVIGSSYSGASAAPPNGLLVEGKVGIGTNAPASSAVLDVTSTTSGVLLPRITKSQRDAIVSPANGLMIFCTNCGTDGSLCIYTNGSWKSYAPCILSAPAPGASIVTPGQIVWNWNSVAGATGYKWSVNPDYVTATDMGTNLSQTETGVICNNTYTRYIWAYSGCGESGMTTLSQPIPATTPDLPTAGIPIPTQTSIVWNWNIVAGATGYKWNIVDDYTTATDMASVTTKTETLLTCGTGYTRYVWAYNGCGYTTSVALTQSTWDCGTCGSLTINHVAGDVAPVDKTVTYGTVVNIPGEPNKCWITSNLGADHQATAVNDATEPSAGWYWQFNRKQGYKHDGTTRTPNTIWINTISENLEWEASDDPCKLELGNEWRIPTYVEWINVDAVGNWSNRNGPWNSGLKLHTAGDIRNSDGSLEVRGSIGNYWSNAQTDATYCWYFRLDSSSSYMSNITKTYGFTLRCIKDNSAP